MTGTTKKILCPVDGRAFKSKAALAQHRIDAHGGAKQTPVVVKRKAVLRRPRGAGVSAPVSLPSAVHGGGSDMARLSGVDRLYHGDISTRAGAGVIAFDLLITPGSFARLKTVSAAYQRIRYLRLVFRVETQISTNTSGGYVVGFVRDPADVVSNINSLMSQQGSVATKWWQSTAVSATPPNRLFYTSESAEIREFSPGKLMMIIDGKATQSGTYTVYAEWSVELSGAGLENTAQMKPSWNAISNWYTRSTHQGLWTGKTDKASSKISDLIGGGVRPGMFFKLPYSVVVTQSNGHVRNAHWVKAQDDNTLLPCYESPEDVDDGQMVIDDLLISKGSVLDDVTPPPVQGELKAPSSSDSPMMTADLYKLLQVFAKGLELSPNDLLPSGRSLSGDYLKSPEQKEPLDSTGSS